MNTAFRTAREAKGWTQAQLGRAVELDQASISRIEGGWMPPIPIRARLCAALEMEEGALFPPEFDRAS